MSTTFDDLLAVYAAAGWELDVVPGKPIGSITFEGTNATFVFVATFDAPTNVATVFARAPRECPDDRRAEMGVLLHRLNFGLAHGAWVMDIADGEIRFRVGHDQASSGLDPAAISSITNYATTAMDETVAAINAVIDGASTDAAYSLAVPA